MGDIKLRDVDPPVQDGELPPELQLTKKFQIPAEYFSGGPHALPKLWKKLSFESEEEHYQRVKNMLITANDDKFSDISNLIDPTEPQQLEFFNLYNKAMKYRIQMKKYGHIKNLHSSSHIDIGEDDDEAPGGKAPEEKPCIIF